MRHMYLAFLLLMVLPASVFAADWSGIQNALSSVQPAQGRAGALASTISKVAEQLKTERETEEAMAQAQALAQYQYQLQQQQQLNQGSSQGQAKIFSSVVYLDAVTAQNAYNDFLAGRQIFNGEMFTLNQIQDASYHSLYDSLQVRQLTAVLQSADGRYYIVVRLQ